MRGGQATEQTAGMALRADLGRHRRARPTVSGWGLAAIAVAAALAVRSYDGQLPFGQLAVGERAAPLYAMIAVAPAVLLVAAGVLAHGNRPASLIGLLLIAEGLAWNAGTLAYSTSYVPAAAELSTLVAFIGYAIGAHVMLGYPDGRLRRRADRVLAGLLYLVLGPGLVVTFLFHGDYGPGCPLCLSNGFLLTPNATLDLATNAAWYAAGGALIGLAGLRSLPRWRAASPVARRSVAPVYLTRWALVATVALWCAIGAGIVVADTTVWGLRAQIAVNIAAVAVAGGILVVFMRSTAARGAAGDLARALDASNPLPPGHLQDAIRSALDDPAARLLFGRPHGIGWLDADGRPAAPHAGRSVTAVAPGSAIEHDPVLDDDPTVVESVAAVAELALEAERLRSFLRAHDASAGPTILLGDVLTGREREVLALAADGLTDTAIAQRLYLTRRTVETHLGHVFTKLEVPAGSTHNRRVHAVRRFLEARQPEP
jgi:DNA-binding CsgD family transcriptional regulator